MVAPDSRYFLTSQFKLRNLWFNLDQPLLLGTPQYGRCCVLYLVYRALCMLFWIGFLLYDIATYIGTDDSFYTYMSNWSLVLLTISSSCQFLASVYCYVRCKDLQDTNERPISETIASETSERETPTSETEARETPTSETGARETPVLLQLNWFFYDMATPLAFFISVVYFTAIYTIQPESTLSIAAICVHLLNSIYVISDLLITAVPFRLMHFWLPEIFGITYTIFSVSHWGATGAEPIYHILDYENSPGLSAVYLLCVAFIASPLFHFITFCLYWLRLVVYEKLCSSCRADGQTGGEDVEGRIMQQYGADAKQEEAVMLTVKI